MGNRRLERHDQTRQWRRYRSRSCELREGTFNQDLRRRRKSVFDSHYKLHVGAIVDEPKVDKFARAVDVGQIEDFDLWQNAMFLKLRRQRLNKGRRVFVDNGRKVYGSGGKRSHVGLEEQRTAPCRRVTAASAGRELHNDAWTQRADALLHLSEKRRVGRRAFIRVADVYMDKRGARFEGLMNRLNLLCWRYWHGRIVPFPWDGSSNGNGNDHRLHGRTFLSAARPPIICPGIFSTA
jgi:hypothetical protein